MEKSTYDFGLVGIGVMGYSLLRNIADRGVAVVGLTTQEDQAEELNQTTADGRIGGTTDAEAFVQSLRPPRRVMLMVPAGKVVDEVIDALRPLLAAGDIILDGGNSHFSDTERRQRALEGTGIEYLGVGVSGGEEGARYGPSIMPGGSADAYERVQPVLEAIAARVHDEPCVAFLGRGAAGHFVKMVHNGIEYGLMQLLAETYDYFRQGLRLSDAQQRAIFARWNDGRLQSFLVEITAEIFAQPDDRGEGLLINKILDRAKQKGTGKWTTQAAMDLGVPVPVIDTAVTARYLSALKEERVAAAQQLAVSLPPVAGDTDARVREAENALYFATIVTFAQGMALLAEASRAHDYGLQLHEVARIWRGGCIIRAALLEDIAAAYRHRPDLPNLLVDDHLGKVVAQEQADARAFVGRAVGAGLPVPAYAAALGYFDAYRRARLPANLIQAQRDKFGSHTYERVDAEGTFHTDWNPQTPTP